MIRCYRCKTISTKHIVIPYGLNQKIGYTIHARLEPSCQEHFKAFYKLGGEFSDHLLSIAPWSRKLQDEIIEMFDVPYNMDHHKAFINESHPPK